MYNNRIVYRYIDPKEVVLNKNNVTEYNVLCSRCHPPYNALKQSRLYIISINIKRQHRDNTSSSRKGSDNTKQYLYQKQ